MGGSCTLTDSDLNFIGAAIRREQLMGADAVGVRARSS